MDEDTDLLIAEEGGSSDTTPILGLVGLEEQGHPPVTGETTPLRLAAGRTDTGWAWLVLLASFSSLCVTGFIYQAFSVLEVEFEGVYHVDLAALGWMGSVLVGCMHIFGFVYSAYITQCGCRVVAMNGALVSAAGMVLSALAPSVPFLYITYGVIGGVGCGMIFLPAVVVIQQYFDRYRGLATGISVSGLSVGALVAGPLTQLLLDRYGWRGTLLLIGGIFLQVAIAGALYRPFTKTIPLEPRPSKRRSFYRFLPACCGHGNFSGIKNRLRELFVDLLDFSLFRNLKYSLFWAGTLCLNVGLFSQWQHVPNRAVHHGVDIHRAALLPTVYGAVAVISSVVFGGVGSLRCTNRLAQYGVGIFSGGVIIVLSVLAKNYTSMVVSYACYSLTCGIMLSSQYPALVDLFGLDLVARAQALLSLSFGLGGLFGMPFAGYLYDITQSYDYTYYITGSVQAAGGLVILTILVLRRRSYT